MMSKTLYGWMIGLCIGAYSAPSEAHIPGENTARITLRDNQIEVVAELDLLALGDEGATEIATRSESRLNELIAGWVAMLETETQLVVGESPVGLVVRQMPSPPEIRAAAAMVSAGKHQHGQPFKVRLESTKSVGDSRTVSLVLPTALGPSFVTFVQPSTQYAQPGVRTTFEVLKKEPPGRTPTPPTIKQPSLAESGAVLLSFTIGIIWMLKRKPEKNLG